MGEKVDLKPFFAIFWKRLLRRLKSHVFSYFPLKKSKDLEDTRIILLLFMGEKVDLKPLFAIFWKRLLRRLKSHVFSYFPLKKSKDLEDTGIILSVVLGEISESRK
jgi:hypothetical protein